MTLNEIDKDELVEHLRTKLQVQVKATSRIRQEWERCSLELDKIKLELSEVNKRHQKELNDVVRRHKKDVGDIVKEQKKEFDKERKRLNDLVDEYKSYEIEWQKCKSKVAFYEHQSNDLFDAIQSILNIARGQRNNVTD